MSEINDTKPHMPGGNKLSEIAAEASRKREEQLKNQQTAGQQQTKERSAEEKAAEEKAAEEKAAAEVQAKIDTAAKAYEEAQQKAKAEEFEREVAAALARKEKEQQELASKNFNDKDKQREELAKAAASDRQTDEFLQTSVDKLVVDTTIPTGRMGTFIISENSRFAGPRKFFKSSFPTFNFDVEFPRGGMYENDIRTPRRGYTTPTVNFGKHRFVGGWFITNHAGVAHYIEENFVNRVGIPMLIVEGTEEEYFDSRKLPAEQGDLVQPVIEPLPGAESVLRGSFTTGPTNSRTGVVKA